MTQANLEALVAPVLTYQTLDDLSEQVSGAVVALWGLRATLEEAEWFDLLVDMLSALLVQAEAVGRLYGSAAVPVDGDLALPDEEPGQRRRAPEDFTQRSGIAPAPSEDLDEERYAEVEEQVREALDTIVSEGGETERVERLARDEAIAATQRGYQDGIRLQHDERIVGYRRGVNPDCCELCFWLWKEGYVYDIDQPMHRHIGCRCWPIPTTDSVGRQSRDHLDEAGIALLDRYYKGEIEETTYRQNGKNPN